MEGTQGNGASERVSLNLGGLYRLRSKLIEAIQTIRDAGHHTSSTTLRLGLPTPWPNPLTSPDGESVT